ncbi:uncharacterized protein Msi isoform X2 [Polyergus mexicanus]|uniref:uncharacterized protein Msi isoform X2 n=1 Tax=Polyergus mexicanus TaxID=615972 RepID=UPI0038B4CB9F
MFSYATFPVGAGMEATNGAIEHDFHNTLVPINGSHSGSSGRSTPNGGDPAPGKLFVGGLSWQTSSEKLREYFGMFGTVTDVLIMKDPVTQHVRRREAVSVAKKDIRLSTLPKDSTTRQKRREQREEQEYLKHLLEVSR